MLWDKAFMFEHGYNTNTVQYNLLYGCGTLVGSRIVERNSRTRVGLKAIV